MGWLDGERVLLTGGGSGIGRAVVERFVEEGARVAVMELNEQKVEQLRKDLGDSIIAMQGNAASLEDNRRAVAETVKAFGGLDVLVPNAGIFDNAARLYDIPEDQLEGAFDELFGVNVKGYLLAAKVALPELIKTQGSIVFTVSYAGFYAAGGGILYTASKHAVLGIVRQLAYELAPKVRVNGVAPGVADTLMRGIQSLGQGDIPSLMPGTKEVLPLQFNPDNSDHAAAYVLLASRKNSRAVTGTVIPTDSGLGIRGLGKIAGGLDL